MGQGIPKMATLTWHLTGDLLRRKFFKPPPPFGCKLESTPRKETVYVAPFFLMAKTHPSHQGQRDVCVFSASRRSSWRGYVSRAGCTLLLAPMVKDAPGTGQREPREDLQVARKKPRTGLLTHRSSLSAP